MKTYLDCIPCFVRQTLESVRMVTDDETVHEDVLLRVIRDIGEMESTITPPEMGQRIHRLIREASGNPDPYRAIKDQSNRLILRFYPDLEARVTESDNPLETAVRLAIAGNIIDCAQGNELGEISIREAIEHSLVAPLNGELDEFAQAISEAGSILYLADNAGEIVLDRLLIEQLPVEKVTVVVRGGPVINDATCADAETAGLTEIVEVIDNGSDVPGTILEDCSEDFRRRFEEADLIIAKGQGNYETLSEVQANITFVFKAKCPVIARDIGCPVGSLMLRRCAGFNAMKGESHAQ